MYHCDSEAKIFANVFGVDIPAYLWLFHHRWWNLVAIDLAHEEP